VDPDSKRLPPRRRGRSSARAGEGLHISVSNGRGRSLRDGDLARWLAGAVPARWRGEVAIALVTDAHIRKLNQQYRHKNAPTDVLSFPADDAEGAAGTARRGGRAPRGASRKARVASVWHGSSGSRPPDPGARHGTYLGDVVIATGVARRQAREAGHSYATELRVLALHGLLHLLGYDHDSSADRGRMARAEARLRRSSGLAAGLIERSRGTVRKRVPTSGTRPRKVRR
jgi:probable rRNA maturation factor